jgi:hypothetical protein
LHYKGVTYIDDTLDLAKDSGDWSTDKGKSLKEARLTDQDIEQVLMNSYKLCIKND